MSLYHMMRIVVFTRLMICNITTLKELLDDFDNNGVDIFLQACLTRGLTGKLKNYSNKPVPMLPNKWNDIIQPVLVYIRKLEFKKQPCKGWSENNVMPYQIVTTQKIKLQNVAANH